MSRYRSSVKILPGPPLSHHEQWLCSGCGAIDWFSFTNAERVQRRWHCGKPGGCWEPLVNVTYLGLSVDVVLATHMVGGGAAVKALCDAAARARDGDGEVPVHDATTTEDPAGVRVPIVRACVD